MTEDIVHDVAFKRWMEKLAVKGSKKTARTFRYFMRLFCDWAKMSPSELLELRKRTYETEEVEDLLRRFYVYLRDEKKQAPHSCASGVTAVRSFINRMLPRMRIGRLDLPRAYSVKERPRLDRADLKKVVLAATPRQRAAILFLYQSLMRTETAAAIEWSQVDLNAEPPVLIRVRGDQNPKARLPYSTFIDRDAVDALKALGGGEGRIFASGTGLRKLVREAGRRVGIELTPRALRALGSTHLRDAGCPPDYVELFLGHVVKYDAAYLTPSDAKLREAYRKADLNLLGKNLKAGISDINRQTEDLLRVLLRLLLSKDPEGAAKALSEAKLEIEWNPLAEPEPVPLVAQRILKELLA